MRKKVPGSPGWYSFPKTSEKTSPVELEQFKTHLRPPLILGRGLMPCVIGYLPQNQNFLVK